MCKFYHFIISYVGPTGTHEESSVASSSDITVELLGRIAAHHEEHPTDYRDFEGPNGLILTTSAGWSITPTNASRAAC